MKKNETENRREGKMRIYKDLIKGLFVIVCLLTVNSSVGAANHKGADIKLTKNITKSYPIREDGELDVLNKYGKVIVKIWNEDSVKVSVDIEAFGKNYQAVEKLMKSVEIDFLEGSNYVSVETDMNKKSGGFSSVLSSIKGYSKNLLNNKSKLTVDYTIHIPKSISLNLENKFGNIFIGDDLEGSLDLELAHGDLKTRALNGRTNISLSYGNGRIKYIRNGFVKLKGGELDVDDGIEIDIQSSSSELTFGAIKSLKVNSRNDKIRADDLGILKGSGDFTDIFVSNVQNDLDLNLEYGELFIERIGEDFRSISLNSKSADINLVLSPKSYFTANISGNEERMIVPNSMLSLGKRDNSGAGYDFTLSGTVGYTRKLIGKVNIKANSADLIISIKETSIFTKSK